MTGHTPPPSQRAAVARLDRDTLRAVAMAYRARRQEGASDGPAYEAAVAELHSQAPALSDKEAREAASVIIARAATVQPARMHGRDLVRLIVPAVFALGSIGTERRQAIERCLVKGELDDGAAGIVMADNITALQDLSQQLFRLTHRPARSLDANRAQPYGAKC